MFSIGTPFLHVGNFSLCEFLLRDSLFNIKIARYSSSQSPAQLKHRHMTQPYTNQELRATDVKRMVELQGSVLT